MKIFSIETSCDETSAAVIENGRIIIKNVVSSSKDLHTITGGIIPEIAAREQLKCIIPVINEALGNSNNLSGIDSLAVTVGPGLNGSLLIGVETAKALAMITGKPLIPVNHIFAHLYANWLDKKHDIVLPAIGLVVSGGHTELFLVKKDHTFKWLGGTRDDAAGEAFDKTARLIDLGYPGGPAISASASQWLDGQKLYREITLPRPMMDEDNLEFSFSGLKTAVIREVNRMKIDNQWNEIARNFIAYEIQEAITDVLTKKTLMAVKQFNVSTLIIGGGVAANKRLTEKFKEKIKNEKLKISLNIPIPPLCTDNAAYIASYAYFHNNPQPWQEIQAKPDLAVEV